MKITIEAGASLLWLAVMSCCLGALATPTHDVPVTTFYVDNVIGSDQLDGLSASKAGTSGPCATIMGALKKATVGARISIANTGTDYREFVKIQGFNKGRANAPLVIEGNGAAVSGLVEVPAARWTRLKDDLYWFENRQADDKPGRMPNSNWLSFDRHQGWLDQAQAPQIFFLNGNTAPSCTSLVAIAQGGFFYDTMTAPRRLYFRLPAGTKLEACKIDVPLNEGVFVTDDYVVLRNLISRYSQDDGFAGYWGIGVVLENVNGSYNCDQGISFHGTSSTTIDGGLFERNGGCGIVDVESCVSVYRNVVVRDNAIGGALFDGLGHALLDCHIYGNERKQVEANADASLNMRNCLVVGPGLKEPRTVGVCLWNGRGRLEHCTIVNCGVGVQVRENANIKNSIIADCPMLMSVAKDAVPKFAIGKTLLSAGAVELGETVFAPDKLTALTNAPQAKGLVLDVPKWDGPAYRLATNSPGFKAAEHGWALGASLPEHIGWDPGKASAGAGPHP